MMTPARTTKTQDLSAKVMTATALLGGALIAALPAMTAFAADPSASHTGEVLSPINKGLVTAITTLVVFVLLIAILSKFAFAPIAAGLKKREDKIRQDITDAENANKKAQASLAELSAKLSAADGEVRAIIARAQADAENIATNIRTKAQQESEEIRERAEREIDQAKGAAIKEIYAQAADLSTAIAEKILRRNLSVEDQRSLVAESLSKLDANKN